MDDRKNMKVTMVQKAATEEKSHNIIIENRRKMNLSGIANVESFNELEIVLETQLGILTIKGMSLHMSKLNLETGDLIIDGSVDSCVYSERQDLKTKGAGFLGKLFK